MMFVIGTDRLLIRDACLADRFIYVQHADY